MALAEIKKIQLIGISQHKDKILEILQNSGTLDIIEPDEEEATTEPHANINELQKIELTYANLEFVIKLLSPYAKKKGMLSPPIATTIEDSKEKTSNFDYQKIIEECTEIEEALTKAKNALSSFETELETYKHWKSLATPLQSINGTDTTKAILGSVKTEFFGPIIEKTHKLSDLISSDVVSKSETDTYFIIIFENELETEIRQVLSEHKFSEAEFPEYDGLLKDHLKEVSKGVEENKEIIKKLQSQLKELAENQEELQVAYDYFGWQKEKLETEKNAETTEYSFALNAWIPKENLKKLEEILEEETNQYTIREISLKKEEKPPVVLENNKFLQPFEAVTNIYGLPLHAEIDPTPFLAGYFIVFFGICLTDAGYGLIMFVLTALALKFLHLETGIKKLVKLLMYGGIVTFVIGAIFGGWFGLTPDQVPSALTYIAANGEKLFIFQKINALTDPLTVLILALSVGFIQILMGTLMKLVHDFRHSNKKDAILDTGTWAFMLTGIGFAVLAAANVIPSALAVVGKWWVITAAVTLILTQGRDKKSIVGKFFSGLLSLYNLVGYLSDVLSYARLLALGLATAIIGLAVNIIADLVQGMIPYFGWILMIVVFIGGHIFNLIINSLGAFIHSGRLQFVEFFGKFLSGGGAGFKPFSKKSKYVYIKNN